MKEQLLDALIKISSEINSTMELDTLLPDIVKITGDYLNVRSASIMLMDWDSLKINCYTGLSQKHKSSPLKKDIAGDVAGSGTEYIVNRSETSGSGAQSFLALPLKAGSKILGVFNLTDKDNNYFNEDDISIARYIASQCALAIERNNIYSKMRANENLQAIGMLKSSVAHDISNLLGIADVYLSLMEDDAEKGSSMSEYITAVKSEIKRISILATDMLDLSKDKLNIHKSRFYISELVNELKMYSKALTENSDIEIDYKVVENIMINADKNRLFRVFFNLVNNAADALEGNKGCIQIKVKKTGDYVSFTVFDNGKGISPENQKKLFQPFFTSGKIKGTGLGLAIVKDIVSAHNGFINLRSVQSKYTCFVIRIPIDG